MEWISAKNRLPENNIKEEPCLEYYIVYVKKFGWQKAMFIKGKWRNSYISVVNKKVTHWMEVKSPK